MLVCQNEFQRRSTTLPTEDRIVRSGTKKECAV